MTDDDTPCCLVCGHGTPVDGTLCRACLDSGETFDKPYSPMERAFAARVIAESRLIEALGPRLEEQ